MPFSFSGLKNELNCDSKHFFVSEYDFRERGFVIYGAGFHTQNCLLPVLKMHDCYPKFIVDSNEKKWGKDASGIEVRSPDSLFNIKDQYIIISGTQMREMALDCAKRGVYNYITPSAIKHFCWTLGELGCSFETLCEVENEARKIYRCLADDLSKKLFLDVFSFMSLNEVDFESYCEKPQYFSPSLINMIDYREFVDVGTFSGDTFDDLVAHFKNKSRFSYYGIDCIHENIDILAEKTKKFDFVNTQLFEFAASSQPGKLFFLKENVGGSSTCIACDSNVIDTVEVEARTIDSLQLPRVSVIKADIEGAEIEMLRGAVRTIRSQRPTLIISTYHRLQDMLSIPSFVISLGLNYKIFFRHHSRYHADTVCYAIPSD